MRSDEFKRANERYAATVDKGPGEFEEAREPRSQFLRAVYDLNGGVPGEMVMLHQVAERMDLHTSDPEYVKRLTDIERYLGAWDRLKGRPAVGVCSLSPPRVSTK